MRNHSSTFETAEFALPTRETPTWESTQIQSIINREQLVKVITGKLPIGILNDVTVTTHERLSVIKELEKIKIKKYDNTDASQRVMVWGKPLVDSDTITNHLMSPVDDNFEMITTPLFNKVVAEFRKMGFTISPLVDSTTLLSYPSKVCRLISLPEGCYTEQGNQCTVLHCDDIIRDSLKKSDFRYPVGLENSTYYQFSVCIQLSDGGYRPDDLFVYERQYSPELEKEFLPNGWQFPIERVKDCRSVSYTPELGRCYLFSTLQFHDVRGGDPRANRLNFSLFFIYVPEINTMFYYN